MTSFYTGLRSTADTLLRDKGQTCVLTVVTPGTYDPNTGTSTPTTATYTVTAAVFAYPEHVIDGTRIKTSDSKVLMSALDTSGVAVPTPKADDVFTDEAGAVFTVIAAKPTAPGGTAVIWTLQVRA